MNGQTEAERRKAELLEVMQSSFDDHDRTGKAQRYLFLCLTCIGLAGAAAAFIIGQLPEGTFFNSATTTKYALALVAAIPSASTIIASTYSLDERQGWHYRKKLRIRALIWRLKFGLPESPSLDNLAALSKALAQIDSDMVEERPRSTPHTEPIEAQKGRSTHSPSGTGTGGKADS
jgi:hypothetical protein